MQVYRRITLEYIFLGSIAIVGLILGIHDPIQHLGTAHAPGNQFSVWTIF